MFLDAFVCMHFLLTPVTKGTSDLLEVIMMRSSVSDLAGKCEKYPGTSKKVYKYKTYGEQWEAFFVYVNGTVARE